MLPDFEEKKKKKKSEMILNGELYQFDWTHQPMRHLVWDDYLCATIRRVALDGRLPSNVSATADLRLRWMVQSLLPHCCWNVVAIERKTANSIRYCINKRRLIASFTVIHMNANWIYQFDAQNSILYRQQKSLFRCSCVLKSEVKFDYSIVAIRCPQINISFEVIYSNSILWFMTAYGEWWMLEQTYEARCHMHANHTKCWTSEHSDNSKYHTLWIS